MAKEITRRNTLLKCLKHLELMKKMDSKDQKGMEPLDKETAESFYELEEECRIIRELIQANESEPVRKAIADWQKEVMDNPQGSREKAMDFGIE